MNKFIFYPTLLLVSVLFSQSPLDSLNLSFSSDFEETIIKRAIADDAVEANFLKLLFAADSTYSDDRSENKISNINAFLFEMEKKVNVYNEKKKVKYLFSKVHDHFFDKYELNAYFPDIFDSSTYNCVTGTALYSHAFDYFSIPYQIKETPTHVFIVAYPQKHNIYIETTVPGKSGSFSPSESMVKKAVDELVSMKLLTYEEVMSKGYSKAFNDYYYGDENISKTDLIGIQYFNKAIFLFQEKNYQEAYFNISKSRLFYKKEKANLLSKSILFMLMDETDFTDLEQFDWFLRFAEDEKDIDYLNYKLGKIVSEDTWGDNEFTFIENELNQITVEDKRTALLETFYEFMAARNAKLQKHKKTLGYSKKVLELNPNHLTAKNYISESEIMDLANKNMTSARLDDLMALTMEYPFIKEFGVYQRYEIFLYCFLTADSFENNSSSKGLEYLSHLENLMEASGNEISFNQEAVGNAYGSAGAYYYRTHKKNRSIEYLKRGLEYSPDNANIKRKLRLIKNTE